jgi:glyceraldehyde 3-phosphate dehydrogenase
MVNLTGMAFRVPTPDVSVVDLTVRLEKGTTYDEICAAMKKASEGELKGVLVILKMQLFLTISTVKQELLYSMQMLVSLDDNFVKVVSWYDNEMGYSAKVCELIEYMESVK